MALNNRERYEEIYGESRAQTLTIDFSKGANIRQHKSGRIRDRVNLKDVRPVTGDGKLLTPKQIRARARRKAAKTSKRARHSELLTEVEFEALYKPIEEWSLEELARGRPKHPVHGFQGAKPRWITREVHERAMEQFQMAIKTELGVKGITALDTIQYVLDNEDVDEKGKPVVPASTKLQAATFVVEHLIGKPKQQVQQDISVKLQGILGAVMVNPNDALAPQSQGGMGGFELAHFPGQTIPIGELGMRDDEEEDWGDGGE